MKAHANMTPCKAFSRKKPEREVHVCQALKDEGIYVLPFTARRTQRQCGLPLLCAHPAAPKKKQLLGVEDLCFCSLAPAAHIIHRNGRAGTAGIKAIGRARARASPLP